MLVLSMITSNISYWNYVLNILHNAFIDSDTSLISSNPSEKDFLYFSVFYKATLVLFRNDYNYYIFNRCIIAIRITAINFHENQ